MGMTNDMGPARRPARAPSPRGAERFRRLSAARPAGAAGRRPLHPRALRSAVGGERGRPRLGGLPALLVEVTSKSTEKKDRGVKLEDYLQIATQEEYLIVAYDRRELELWTRSSGGWTRRLAVEGSLHLECGADVDVEKLYADLPP